MTLLIHRTTIAAADSIAAHAWARLFTDTPGIEAPLSFAPPVV